MSRRDDMIAQAQLYAEGAPVAQRTEQRSSKPTDAGSTPVEGASTRVHAALEGFAGADRRMTDRRTACPEVAWFRVCGGDWVGACNGTLGPDGVCCYEDTHCDPNEKL